MNPRRCSGDSPAVLEMVFAQCCSDKLFWGSVALKRWHFQWEFWVSFENFGFSLGISMPAAVGASTLHRRNKPRLSFGRRLWPALAQTLSALLVIISPVPQNFLGWEQCSVKHKDFGDCVYFGNCLFLPVLWNETTGDKIPWSSLELSNNHWISVLVLLPVKSVPSQNSDFPWQWLWAIGWTGFRLVKNPQIFFKLL